MSGEGIEAAPRKRSAAGRVFAGVLGAISALLLLGLMALTCVDVVGRYLFDAPLEGAFEITEVMLLALVFAAFPLTTARGQHVEVDLLAMLASASVNRLLLIFGGLFSAALLGTFAWRLIVHAAKAAEDGSVTNALSIPLAPFGYLAAAACFASAAAAAWGVWLQVEGRDGK